MINQRKGAAGARQLRGVDVVLEHDRNTVKWAAYFSRCSFRITRPGVRDSTRVNRQHGAKRRAVAIVERQTREILAGDVLGGDDALRHGGLEVGDGFFEDRELRVRLRFEGRSTVV